MPAPGVEAGALERGFERTFVPSSEFGDVLVGVTAARRLLRCDHTGIAALLAAGLPTFGADGESFRRSDILNVGLYSGSGRTIPEIAEAHRIRFATGPRTSWTEARAWDVAFDLRCARGCDGGSWLLRRPSPERFGGSVREWPATPVHSRSPLRLEASVVVTGSEDAVESEDARRLFVELVDDLVSERIRYQYLPPGLRREPETAAANRVLDCMAASLLLERRCRNLGLPTRTRKGLLLGAASVEHVWLELPGVAGEWAPLDPVLAALVARSGDGEGFARFACGSASNRLLPWELGAARELAGHSCPDRGELARAEDLMMTVSARPLAT
ncbi:MAG TPA: transglutaminase domain-containing protein [Solirubrobacterales bacterium]|nr:transglutaminase domain-containing protein [Solirubrobacterales bacterium]